MRRVFTANGTWNWPTGVTIAIIEAIGGGGCGGWGAANPSTGGGGKGGSYGKVTLTKGAESSLTIVVGQGGAATVGNGDEHGTASTVTQNSTIVLSAAGGQGVATDTLTGATAINGSNTEGDLHYAGGNGADGASAGGNSGAGGGAAGPGGVGGAASGTTAGTAHDSFFSDGVKYGGDGGAGVAVRSVGNPGASYGGGGAGGSTNQSADKGGGAGGNGVVVISWAIPEPLKLSDSATASREDVSQDLSKNVGAESLKLDDTGQGMTALYGVIHVTESAAVVLSPLVATVADDSLEVTDSATALLPVLVAAPADDGLKLGETDPVGSLVDLADLTAAPPDDGAKLGESISAVLDPLATSVSDNLKLSDENPTAERIEAGALTASAQESLIVVDTGNGRTALYGVIHVTESITDVEMEAEAEDLERDAGTDGLKLSDSATSALDPLIPSPASDSLKVSDTATALLLPLEAVPADENLKVSETVPAFSWTDYGDLNATPPAEQTKLSEVVGGLLDPLAASVSDGLNTTDSDPQVQWFAAGELTATTTESLKLQDTGNGRTALLGFIHVTEAVTDVEMGEPVSGDLSRDAGAEGLKISDAVQASIGELTATPTSDALKVLDTIAALEPVILASASETLFLLDGSDSWAALFDIEPIHVTESAQAEIISAADLSQNVGSESLKVSESAAARLAPLVAVVTDSLKIGESLNASFGLAATGQESLKVSDSVTARLNPLQASAIEAVKGSDTVTNAQLLDFGALAGTPTAESVHVTEAPSVVLNPLRASTSDSLKVGEDFTADRIDAGELTVSRTELLHVTESATGTLAPLLASVLDAVTLSEQVIAGIGLSANVSESLKVSDAISQTSLVAVNTLTADVADSLQIAETLEARLDPLVATASESVIVTDEAIAGTDLLQVVITAEGVKISDQADADANILVRPIDLMGTDVAYFDLEGTDARTMDYTVTLE